MSTQDPTESILNRPAKTVASVKNAIQNEQSKVISPTYQQEIPSECQNEQSSNQSNSEDRHKLELSNLSKNSTILVRKRKAHTSKKIGSDKKNKNFDSDDDSKIKEIEHNCRAEFLYNIFYPLPSLTEYLGSYIKVIVAREHLTNQNQAIIKRFIWGNDFYSSNSDIVCILQHSGVIKLQELPPKYPGIAVYFKVSKNRNNYTSHFRNGIRSKKSQSFDGHSLKFETAIELSSLGTQEQLNKLAASMPAKSERIKRKQKQARKAVEQEMDMSIVFNLSGEPINKFNLGEFGDRRHIDRKVSESIETEVLYLETLDKRYEISFNAETKKYAVKHVLNPLFKDLMYMKAIGVPLPENEVKVLHKDLEWKEFLWGERSLRIREDFKLEYINGYLYVPIKNE